MTCGRAWCVWWYAGWHCAHPPGSQMCGPCCPVASCPPRRLARWSRWACSSRLSFVRFVPLVFAVRARLVARPLASSSASAPRPRFSARAIASGPISIRRASALFPVCLVRSMYASLRGARARPASLYVLGVSLLRFACRARGVSAWAVTCASFTFTASFSLCCSMAAPFAPFSPPVRAPPASRVARRAFRIGSALV